MICVKQQVKGIGRKDEDDINLGFAHGDIPGFT